MGSATINLAALRIGSFYTQTTNSLAHSLNKISSGKNYNAPRDGVSEFMRIENVRNHRRGYGAVKSEIAEGKAMLNVAESAGELVVGNIKRMKELTDLYWMASATSDDKEVLKREFDALAQDIEFIKQSTVFQGRDLMKDTSGGDPVKTIRVDPRDLSNTIELNYYASDIVDTTSMDITGGGTDKATAMATVDAQMSNAMSYVTRTAGYTRSLNNQTDLIQSMIANSEAYESTVNRINDGTELSKLVNFEIRQQASLSMLAQANTSRQGILRLLG